MPTTHAIQQRFIDGTAPERLAAAQEVISNLDEWLPWLAARELKGLTIKQTDIGWLIILRAVRKRTAQVCFIDGDNLQEVLVNTAYALVFGLVTWKDDKFRSMRSDS